MKLMLSLLTILVCFGASADELQWFGTIKYSYTIDYEVTENYKAGDSYYPGKIVTYDRRTNDGTLTFTAPEKMVTAVTHHSKKGFTRNTKKQMPCWNGNTSTYTDDEESYRESNYTNSWEGTTKLRFRIEKDGTYSQSYSAASGKMLPDTAVTRTIRTWATDCPNGENKTDKQEHFDSSNADLVRFVIQGKADPNAKTLTGSWTGTEQEGPATAHIKVTWDLSKTASKVKAKITGPASIERAQSITLSGKTSTGTIAKYTWGFDVEPNEECTPNPDSLSKEHHGEQLTFIALCDFTAHLTVEDTGGNKDTTKFAVKITDRPNWKTTFTTKKGPNFTAPMTTAGMQFGVNQCAHHPADFTSGHYIHTDTPSTWLDSGYKIEQVTDAGPFDGSWYVISEDLKVDRLEKVNTTILPGGDVYNLNVAKNNKGAIVLLAAQVKAHEAMHSSLVKEALTKLGHKGDAAVQIEKLVYPEEDMLQMWADYKVREVNTILYDATSETNVHNKLKKNPKFKESVSIWLRTGNGADIELFDLGPLHSIGD